MRWLVRAVVSCVVVAVLLAFIPFHAVVDALRRTNGWVWFASVVVFFFGHYLNAMKLRLLLGPGQGAAASCVRAQYAGLVANLGLPGIAGGDVVRAAYLAPLVGLPRVVVASISDRLIDTGVLVGLIVCALPIAGVPGALQQVLERAGMWIAIFGVVGATAVVVAIKLGLLRRLQAKGAGSWADIIDRPGAIAGALLISVCVQSAFVMTNVWLAREVGAGGSIAAWFVAWPLSKLIAILPISLGGIGVREAALVSFLVPYGAIRESVLASGILWQGVLIATALAGLLITQLLPQRPHAAVSPKTL